jgi:hypothetical protein
MNSLLQEIFNKKDEHTLNKQSFIENDFFCEMNINACLFQLQERARTIILYVHFSIIKILQKFTNKKYSVRFLQQVCL